MSRIAHVIVLFFASTTSSMILRMPAAMRVPQNTVLVGTTRRESLTSTNTLLQSDTLRDEEENYGIAYSGDNRLKFGPKASTPGFLRKTFPSFPWHFLPNWLTYCRCVAIPMLIIFFYSSRRNVITSGIFAAASATDYLDGYLARKWDISSEFGAFLDPVADKLMVSTALILLAGRYGALVAIPACIILAREIAVSALREWMAGKGLRNLVQVGFQGKLKTATTMLSLTVLLLVPTIGTRIWMNMQALSFFLLYLSTIITVTSGSLYFRAAAAFLVKEKNSTLS